MKKYRLFPSDPVDLNYRSIDIFRALAALAVVLLHFYYYFSDCFTVGKSILIDLHCYIMSNGIRGVEMFFIISGYCICVSAERNCATPFRFLGQRIQRIFPAYWLSIMLGIGITFLINQSGVASSNYSTMPRLYDLLVALPLLHIPNMNYFNAVYWTLGHFMHFYLLAFVAILCLKNRFLYVFDIVTLLIVVAESFQFDWNASHFIAQVFSLRITWVNFYYGIWAYRILRTIHRFEGKLYIAGLGLFILALEQEYIYLVNGTNKFVITVTVIFLLMRTLDRKISSSALMRPLSFLGTISYSMYLIHIFITPRSFGLLSRFFSLHNYSALAGLYLFVLPVTIFSSYIFYLFCEKPFLPARRRVW